MLSWLALPVVLWTALVGGFIPGVVFEDVAAAPTGTFAAFLSSIAAISTAYWIAPRWRFMVASAVARLSTSAWALISFLIPVAPEATDNGWHVPPFFSCLIGGAIAMAGISYCEKRRVRSQVNSPAPAH